MRFECTLKSCRDAFGAENVVRFPEGCWMGHGATQAADTIFFY